MTFYVRKWFKQNPISKEKNTLNKKRYNVRASVFHFITVLVSCTRRVIKFCPRNQSVKKGSHLTLLLFTTCRKRKRKNFVIRLYSFRNHIASNILRYSVLLLESSNILRYSVLLLESAHISKNMS